MSQKSSSNIKKIIFILLAVILIACVAVVPAKIYKSQRCFVAIRNDNVYYEMSRRELLKIKGEPYETDTYSDTPFYDYHYIENIEGYEADVWYKIYDRMILPDELNGITVKIKVDNADEAKDLFYVLYNRLNEYYKTQEHYFCDGVENISSGEYSATLGTDDGATGIRIRMSYTGGVLQIHSDYVR